jgi:hypothetical protein
MADENPPLTPPALPSGQLEPAPAGPQQLKPGQQWMIKHPSVGGQWQPSLVVPDPSDPSKILVKFPDGTLYDPAHLEIGGQIAQNLAPGVETTAGETAVVSPLNQDYEAFRRVLVDMNTKSRMLFQLPLNVLLIMVTRLATEREAEANGQMANYTGGLSMFVPDQATFDKWVENYLMEIQTRESGQNAE